MNYRGIGSLCGELLIRFHARSALLGHMVGIRALADTGPGTIDDKLNRAMEALLAGEFETPSLEDARAITGAPRRGPGRPPKPLTPTQNGDEAHDIGRNQTGA